MQPRIHTVSYEEDASMNREETATGSDLAELRRERNAKLIEAFGSQRRKRQLATAKAGRVDASQISAGDAMINIIRSTEADPGKREDVIKKTLADRNIPPHNPEATTPEDAYPFDSIVPRIIQDSIDTSLLTQALSDGSILGDVKQKFGKYVASRVGQQVILPQQMTNCPTGYCVWRCTKQQAVLCFSGKEGVFAYSRCGTDCKPQMALRSVSDDIRRHRLGNVVAPRAAAQEATNDAAGDVPEPVVKIDNQSDSFATLVTVEYGDRLGELLDTTAALRNLGLNIRRAKLKTKNGMAIHKFFLTDARNSEKIVKEREEKLSMRNNVGSNEVDYEHPLGKAAAKIVTQIAVRDSETGMYTKLFVNTVDRPGLLTDIVRLLKDINLNVVSAEVDTVGRNAVDIFNVTYHGEPLPQGMKQLAVNTLQYYLGKGDVEKEWSESY
eukprot:jgi/Picre1/27553/NNA_000520.t1